MQYTHNGRLPNPSLFANSVFFLVSLTAIYSSANVRAADYEGKIKPVLQARCYSCHGALKQEAGLRLDTAEKIRSGGNSGTAISQDAVDDSLILQRIRSSNASDRMPPEGEPLEPKTIDQIAEWIREGANGPQGETPQADPKQHWAFQLPQKSLPAGRANKETDNPIDLWIEAELEARQIAPTSQADRATLLRRVYLDLIGLPPTREELRSFLEDPSEQAYANVVDQLLQRPEYGERWARHWMDVWRYSDWYGRRGVPDVMNSYPQIWRWRDWIVRSLNQDKGYDRMVKEMLAADELAPEDPDAVVATGFLVRNWFKWNYETWMKDNVEHTGKAFLGLTINCAHCHDHKYDPISHEDYFRFRAFFEPLELRHERVEGEADPGPFQKYVYALSYGPIKSGAIRVFDEKLDAKTYMYRGGDARNRIEGKPPVEASPPLAFTDSSFVIHQVNLPKSSAYPGLRSFIRKDERLKIENETSIAVASVKELESQLQSADNPTATASTANQFDLEHKLGIARALLDLQRVKLRALEARIAADDATWEDREDKTRLIEIANQAEKQVAYQSALHALLSSEQHLVERERALAILPSTPTSDPNAAAAELAKQKTDLESAKTAVTNARATLDSARTALSTIESTYTPLSPTYPKVSTGRRTALADWIASNRNPLTARVAVNHIWLRHFGRAIVESTDNFGIQGKKPSHPELLDWLAVELMENQWSMKHLHRLIVTSRTYQRASHADANSSRSRTQDADNAFYWRIPVRRMEAEVIRDSVMAVAGSLDRKIGGPEIDVSQWAASNRRSIYFSSHGEGKMQFAETFDGPNVCDCYRRTSTIMPQQALAMSNSDLLIHQARQLAGRLSVEFFENLPADLQNGAEPKFITAAFQLILGRNPSEQELLVSTEFLQQQASSVDMEFIRTSASLPLTIQRASSEQRQRARENFLVALLNHNDFVTIR